MEKKMYFVVVAIVLAALAVINYMLITSGIDLVNIIVAIFSIAIFISYGLYAIKGCLNDADWLDFVEDAVGEISVAYCINFYQNYHVNHC